MDGHAVVGSGVHRDNILRATLLVSVVAENWLQHSLSAALDSVICERVESEGMGSRITVGTGYRVNREEESDFWTCRMVETKNTGTASRVSQGQLPEAGEK